MDIVPLYSILLCFSHSRPKLVTPKSRTIEITNKKTKSRAVEISADQIL